ncbi:MAG: vWA domain-containing protein [Pseudomonadota bacterium]
MLKRSLGILVALGMAFAALPGCGDSDSGDSEAVGGAPPYGQGGAGAIIGIGASGPTGTGGKSTFDGGTAPLTEDQFELIQNDSCAGWVAEGEAVPSLLELVVDVSSSMSARAPGSNRTKWEVTRDALLEAIVGVNGPGLPESVSVGLLFYPNTRAEIRENRQDISACVDTDAMVPIAVLGPENGAHRRRIREAIQNARLEQSTPTHDAYRYALEEAVLPATFGGKKFMLLITDGAPTVALGCSNPAGRIQDVDPDPIVDEVQRAAEEGVKTFLIGSPGSEPNREWMSYAAVLGGTAPPNCDVNGPDYCHMDMTTAPDFSAALRAGLDEIVGIVSPCRFAFAEPPANQQIDAGKINVVLSSGGQHTLVIRDDQGECSEGWQLAGGNEVLLCPDTCERVRSDPSMRVTLAFGCTSYREPPIVE